MFLSIYFTVTYGALNKILWEKEIRNDGVLILTVSMCADSKSNKKNGGGVERGGGGEEGGGQQRGEGEVGGGSSS